ncbi:MAG: DHA2 family efflux MFS transporter permease subunit [Gammaproteobacteria bacterium]|nr:DHA2 family efflux MFS transporter permease subunit [Gammaproteobacteria bacterium]
MDLLTKRATLFIISLALFMDVLDSNIINTAIPAMSRSFQVNPINLKIALISYLLSLAIFIPISGWTADKYGTKRVFIAALGLFTISSFWCGYAHTLMELVIARSIQGIGGAFMISLGRLIVARTFKRHELVSAMNAVIIVVSVAVMVGPFVGGIITDNFSWPWIFWVNIPVGIFAIIFSVYFLRDDAQKKERPFDMWGFILFGGSLAMLCFSLSQMSETDIDLHASWAMITIAAVMLIIFIIHAKRYDHPVINIELFRIRTFRISVFGNLFSRLGFGGMPFLLPLLQQMGLGFSAQLSGLLLVPMAFGIIFSKLFGLRILKLMGYKNFLLLNTTLVAFTIFSFAIINQHTSVYTIASLTFILGIFITSQFTAMNSLAFSQISRDELSNSTPITSTAQVLGQSLGVAVGAILLRYHSSQLKQVLLTPTVFHQTFFSMGLLTLLSALIFISLRPDDGQQMLLAGSENES